MINEIQGPWEKRTTVVLLNGPDSQSAFKYADSQTSPALSLWQIHFFLH